MTVESRLPSNSFLLVMFFLFVSVLGAIGFFKSEVPLLPSNPSGETAKTTINIWENGTIQRAEYGELLENLLEESRMHPNSSYWADVFAFSPDGTLLPKHCLLISLLAVPFYALFGIFGFWIFNQLVLLICLVGVFQILTFNVGRTPAIIALVLLLLGSQLPLFSYCFSYDLLAAAFLVLSFRFVNEKPLWAGFLIALAIWIRLTNVTLVPFLYWQIALASPSRRNDLIDFSVGMVAGTVPQLFCNYVMWGSPFVTAYGRLYYFRDGQLVPDLGHVFSVKEFFHDWSTKLFAPEVGLLRMNPGLWLLLPALAFLRYVTNSKTIFVILLAAVTSVLLMFAFEGLQHTGGLTGSITRYLLHAIILLSIPIAAGLSVAIHRLCYKSSTCRNLTT